MTSLYMSLDGKDTKLFAWIEKFYQYEIIFVNYFVFLHFNIYRNEKN